MPEEIYCSMYSRNAELYHHGIKGQKWGVRNGPPYPLGSDKSTGKRLKKDKNVDGHFREIRSSETEKFKRENIESRFDPDSRINSNNSKNNNKSESTFNPDLRIKVRESADGELSEDTKESLKALSKFTIALLAALGISTIVSAASQPSIEKRAEKEIEENIKNSLKGGPLKKIEGPHSYKEDTAKVNPNYKKEFKWGMNCALCSATYEMRRRGYDVTANPSMTGRRISDQVRMYNSDRSEFKEVHSYKDFKTELNKMPSGSRGCMSICAGDFGSRHSLAWEKVGNKVLIIDSQTNEIFDFNSAQRSKRINTLKTSRYYYMRTDDKEINEKYIRDACRNR